MAIILCDSWSDAEECYDIFLTFLEDSIPPYSIVNVNDCTLRIKIDDGIEYMFSDYHYCGVFEQDPKNDILSPDEFFEGIPYFFEYLEACYR